MKRTDNAFSIELESEHGQEYINDFAAISAATMLQMNFAMEGFLCVSHLNKENGCFEVTVHFDLHHIPTLPQGYTCTYYTITSHTHCIGNTPCYVRCKTFYFRVKRTIK